MKRLAVNIKRIVFPKCFEDYELSTMVALKILLVLIILETLALAAIVVKTFI